MAPRTDDPFTEATAQLDVGDYEVFIGFTETTHGPSVSDQVEHYIWSSITSRWLRETFTQGAD